MVGWLVGHANEAFLLLQSTHTRIHITTLQEFECFFFGLFFCKWYMGNCVQLLLAFPIKGGFRCIPDPILKFLPRFIAKLIIST